MKECEATDVRGIIVQSFVDCYRLSLLNGNFISKVKPGKNSSRNYYVLTALLYFELYF